MQDEPPVICEKVIIKKDPWGSDENWWQLVQYEDTPEEHKDRDNCLRYLRDCGHEITTEPHPVVGIGDDPAVSWGDLSDIVEPRDD